MRRAGKPLVKCHFCGQISRAHTQWRGSKGLDIFIWVTLFFPAPLYTYWRWKGRREVCRHCGSENIEILPPEQQPEPIREAMAARIPRPKPEPDMGHEDHRF